MSQLAPFAELASFEALDPSGRLALAPALAESLGNDFRPLPVLVGSNGIVGVEHVPSGLRLVAVPGGFFEMGLTAADSEEVGACIDATSAIILRRLSEFEAACSPLRTVSVPPFLLSVAHVSSDQLRTLTGGALQFDVLSPEDAVTFARTVTPFRLPSEAELEYAGREGGAMSFLNDGGRVWAKTRRWPNVNGWGLQSLSLAAWAADEWHEDYEGAPLTSAPWSSGGVPGVYRGSLLHTPDTAEELLFGLAACRGRLVPPEDEWDVCVRAAHAILI